MSNQADKMPEGGLPPHPLRGTGLNDTAKAGFSTLF